LKAIEARFNANNFSASGKDFDWNRETDRLRWQAYTVVARLKPNADRHRSIADDCMLFHLYG